MGNCPSSLGESTGLCPQSFSANTAARRVALLQSVANQPHNRHLSRKESKLPALAAFPILRGVWNNENSGLTLLHP
jgi:hypothetical protein